MNINLKSSNLKHFNPSNAKATFVQSTKMLGNLNFVIIFRKHWPPIMIMLQNNY